ncbi:MAG: hypothetical protein ABSA18_11500 [Dehalococcoidia bacterium]|jgi:hypothetical protein
MSKVPISEQERNSPYYKYFERELAKVPAEKYGMLVENPLLEHNIKAYTNLAAILPEVYSEFKDKFEDLLIKVKLNRWDVDRSINDIARMPVMKLLELVINLETSRQTLDTVYKLQY